MSKTSTITINGRHYDAQTGEPLSPAPHRPVHHAAPGHQRTQTAQRAQSKPAERPAPHRKIGHVAAHHPNPPQTLMRQAVKKPDSDLRRRIKITAHLDSSAQRSSSKILVRSGARQHSVHHLQNHTAKRPKGQLISHFSPDLFEVEGYTPAATYGSTPVKLVSDHAPQAPPVQAGISRPRTTEELLEYAVQHAGNPAQPLPHKQRRLFKRRTHA